MGMQADVMTVALDKYLGSEDQWCTGAMAKDADGVPTSYGYAAAASHCAEGAIRAAYYHVTGGMSAAVREISILKGVEQVLVEQHPDIVQNAVECADCAYEDFTSGYNLPLFNDGFAYGVLDEYGINRVGKVMPGVGYQGIRAAFEKYLAECQEKGL